ncbi:hypothetical protein F8388_000793 [Cannabis sativa]|uniref:Sulfotransferase n=1 Tax=Cannabis sativa TaxID=3483 RepID=A0A7J6E1A8_CANSA|nr:hypothetical protein F8388_000793 [Cannabis sativa]
MEISKVTKNNEEGERVETIEEILAKLEKVKYIQGILSLQTQFVARDDDILLTSCPKSGSLWLKSLIFSIVKRNNDNNGPLSFSTCNPHNLVRALELSLPDEAKPRIMSAHSPYPSLPPSIMSSNCKIIYICRNPLDLFVSHWHFIHKLFGDINTEPTHLEECFDVFCKGVHPFGPFWDHI